MPVTIKGAFTLEADRAVVWAKLHDPDVLRRCLRECEALDKVSDTRFRGIARVRFGLLAVQFRGRIDLQDVDPPHGWRMVGRVEGGLAGCAQGVADVRLNALPEGTAVAYTIEARTGGNLSGLGGRIVDAVAARVAARFFSNLSVAVLATPQVA